MKELPCRHLLDQSQQWQHLNNLWNLLKVNNKDTRTLLLTLSRFHTLVWCFHCWLWPRKCRQGISKETNNNLNIAKNVKDGWMISLLFCSLIWLRAFFMFVSVLQNTQPAVTSLNSTMKTPEQCVKSAKSRYLF